ncbi:MAG: GMC oxidoreductase [Burkholderiales bacterium]
MSINSRPYDGRPPCNDCGYCGGYGCPTHARGSPAVTLLRKALLSGNCQLWPDTRVVGLQLSGDKLQLVGVEAMLADGSRQLFRADRYVLAANAIEDVRLLLMSDPQGPGVGNSSGLVGRNLLFHSKRIAIGIFDERLHGHRGRDGTHAFADFRGVAGDSARPLGGVVYVNASSQPIAEAVGYATNLQPLGILGTPKLKNLLRQSPMRDRVLFLAMYGEDAPQLSNRVDLDPQVRDADGFPVARITYSPHSFETETQKFYEPKLLQLLQQAGARYGALAPLDQPPATAHNMGVLRFGTDPKQSVCDPTGRFHDVGNFYGCDGALFPTASGFNPTLTIIALATRIAAEMVFPGAPERALPC